MEYLKNKIKSIIVMIKENPVVSFLFSLINRIVKHRLTVQSANMTYYLLLALFPFLIFLLGIFSYTALSIDNISEALKTILPMQTSELILGTVEEVLNDNNTTLFSFAMIGAILSSINGARALIIGVNRAYGVTENRHFLIQIGINMFIIVSIPLFAIMSFLLIAMGNILLDLFTVWFNLTMDFQSLISISRYVVPMFMLIFYFTLFYKFVPNLRLPFRKVIVGALFTTFGWIGTSMLFSLYINNFANYTRVYGSLGSIIGLLLWINLSSMIILIGAEIIVLINGDNKGVSQNQSKKAKLN